jgi:hypothetical protein
MKMPRVWEILRRFKETCRFHGWKTSENEDWIERDEEYHNFLWAKDVHLSSFKKIAANRKCIVREGLSYRVVDASYTAWLLSETPSDSLLQTVSENPDLSGRIALYDISPLLEGKSLCLKLNNTDSHVFEEFEHFLKNELKVRFRLFSQLPKTEIAQKDCSINELA